jgi:hypothetical protein
MDRDHSSAAWEPHQGVSRLLPFLLVVGGCLLAGIIMGALAGGINSASKPAGQPAMVFVLLGYDNLKQPRRLEAVWAVTFDGTGHADYFGYSPATIVILDNNQPAVLRDFLSDPLGAPAHLFRIPRFAQPATAIEFDEAGLISIINRSGGVMLDDKTLRGQEAITWMRSIKDPLDSLKMQSRIVESLFRNATPCLSESTLAGLSGEHVIANQPLEALIGECLKRGPYMDDAIRVKILDRVTPMLLPDGSTGLLPTM